MGHISTVESTPFKNPSGKIRKSLIDGSAFSIIIPAASCLARYSETHTKPPSPVKLKTLIAIIPLAVAAQAFGATVATWSASGGANPGTDGWEPDLSGTGDWFQGNSAGNAGGSSGAGAGNPAWGLWSNDGGVSAATWALVGGALTVGQSLGIDFDNGWVDSGGVGVQFTSGGTVALAVFLNQGGPGYEITNSTGNVSSGKGWTGDGFNISVELTGSGTYSLSFPGYSGSGTLANSLTSIDGIRVYSADPTGLGSGGNYDVFFNNVSVIPEPSAALLGGLGMLALLRRRR